MKTQRDGSDEICAKLDIWDRKIIVSDDVVTRAAQLTARQSLLPNLLGT